MCVDTPLRACVKKTHAVGTMPLPSWGDLLVALTIVGAIWKASAVVVARLTKVEGWITEARERFTSVDTRCTRIEDKLDQLLLTRWDGATERRNH